MNKGVVFAIGVSRNELGHLVLALNLSRDGELEMNEVFYCATPAIARGRIDAICLQMSAMMQGEAVAIGGTVGSA